MASTNECQRITVIYGIMWVLEKIHSNLLKTSEMLAQTHCIPTSTVSINLSNVAGAPFNPNDMTRNS
jgi:hypothetical protein